MSAHGASRKLVTGFLALAALVVVVVGVPIVLVRAAGNPWPGWARIELGDERAVVVGVLAALAWLVWARFVLAVVMEVPSQVTELRAERDRLAGAPVALTAPPRPRAGVGLVAARLVAAALVLLPLAARTTPVVAVAPLPAATATLATVDVAPAADQPGGNGQPARPVTPAARSVKVADGDTLIGLARRHLGDAARWREIFELNRDRLQPGGAKLSSPSTLHAGWTLLLPGGGVPAEPAGGGPAGEPPAPAAAGAGAAAAAPATIRVVEGDTLWDLAHDRLEGAGLAHDDPSVAAYVGAVIAANTDVVENPDVIFPGELIDLPAPGPPPPAPSGTEASPPAGAVASPPAAVPGPAGPTDDGTEADAAAAGSTVAPVAAAPASTIAPAITTSSPPTASSSPSTSSASTSTTDAAVAHGAPPDQDAAGAERSPSPFPIGLGEAALLSSGVLALLAARRRARLRASQPRARVPEPPPERITTERTLRAVDAGERLLRVDVAVRAAAASLLDVHAQPAVIRVGADGTVELTLTGEATLPSPWRPERGRWSMPGSIPVELLSEAARSVGAPCVALTQLGVDEEGREVLVDLEALGVLSIHGPDEMTESVLRGIAATLATSVFADIVNLVGVDVDEVAFLDHRLAHRAEAVEEALELATTLIGTTASARQSTFVLRARHTSGEAWEPAVVLTGPGVSHEVTPELVRSVARRRGGVAMVAAGDVPEGPWTLRHCAGTWRLEPLGVTITPVGLSAGELAAVYDVLHEAEDSLAVDEPGLAAAPAALAAAVEEAADEPDGSFGEPAWELMVRVLGPVDVVDRQGGPARFDRSKTLELIAWLTLHRDRSTRAGARTALWELDVRDATFANVVSEARRAMARHVPPPQGEEWLERTLTERLPLHPLVVSDADLVRARLEHARLEPPQQAIETLRPAVELIRDVPFTGTGYLWPDPEGIASNLVLLATSAATELAGHFLSMGDVDGVFWATGQGLKVLPGHEELIALRMRAHHRAGDLSGVRLEWESYERVLDADPWSDGEPAHKLVVLRRELLDTTSP